MPDAGCPSQHPSLGLTRKIMGVLIFCDLFLGYLDDEAITRIRKATNSGMALGNERFKDEIELLAKRRVRPKKAGRPKLEEL